MASAKSGGGPGPGARGLLVVVEGLDKAGKSTQCELLAQELSRRSLPNKHLHFPLRTTAIGAILDDYLNRRTELHDAAVHLLFSANRWECVPAMLADLAGGTTLVLDRYAYSGAAFTAAKPDFSLDWCRRADVGLPAPDLVVFLSLPQEEAGARDSYGRERYEQDEFQGRVKRNFELLREPHWRLVDAARPIELVHQEVLELVLAAREQARGELGKLWS